LAVGNRVVFAAGLGAWLTSALIMLIAQGPLGHDESQYVVAAADVLAGRPTRLVYLSQGTSLLAVPGVAAGGSELAIRILPVMFGVAFVCAAWFLARTLTRSETAAWLVAVMAASIGMVKRSAELLSDMPAASGLLAGTAVLIAELSRESGPRRRILLAAPAFAAALYLRYGSALAIAIIGVLCALAYWRTVVRSPLRVLATAALFVLLLVPHFAIAYGKTGSPLGILLHSTDMITTVSEPGLVTYLTTNPLRFYGIVTTPLLLVGIASIIRVRDRRLVLAWVIAVAIAIAFGLTALAQSRYIYYSQVLLLVLGIEQVLQLAHGRKLLAIAVVVSWALALVSIVRETQKRGPVHFVVDAAAAIHKDAGGAPCRVLSTMPQVDWYCRCERAPDIYPAHLGDGRNYVIVTPAVYPLDPKALPGKVTTLLEERGMTLLRVDP
jgi:hypothetical protein